MGNAVAKLVPAGVQGGARRRTGWTDVKISEAHRFIAEAVEVGCLQDGIAMAGQVPVALVVAQDEDDVGMGWVSPDSRGNEGHQQQ